MMSPGVTGEIRFFVVSFVMDNDGNGRHNKFSINLHFGLNEKNCFKNIKAPSCTYFIEKKFLSGLRRELCGTEIKTIATVFHIFKST